MMNFTQKWVSFAFILLLIIVWFPQQSLAAAYDHEHGHETLDIRFWNNEAPDIGFYINASARYILETVDRPQVGSTFGDWSVMDLLRAKYTGYDYINHIPGRYFSDYITHVEQYVKDKKGVLDIAKSTEWSRLMLALSAIGHDVHNVGGYNFPSYLSQSHKFSYRQGINGPIWELIAMNTGNYQFDVPTTEDSNTAGKMIDYILDREVENGGWTLFGNKADPDITGMALQALAPYYLDKSKFTQAGTKHSHVELKASVERALSKMADIQHVNGSYEAWGNVTAESTVQVLVAVTALQMDPLAPSITLPTINKTISFVTSGGIHDGVKSNNMIDALLSFWAPNSGSSAEVGGFKHVTSGYDGGGGSGIGVDAMATDQVLYGLIAYDRFKKGKNALYNMTDMINGEHQNMYASQVNIELNGNAITETTTKHQSPYSTVHLPDHPGVMSWNTKADGTGVRYYPKDKLVVPEHSITLYAQKSGGANEVDTNKVQDVIALINTLPASTQLKREHATEVARARGNYDKLNSEEKKRITNYNTLVAIEIKMNQILNQYDDELRVDTLIRTINDLYQIQPLTIDYKLAVENARRAYNALSASERLQITNYNKLQELEARMAILIELDKEEQDDAITNGGVPQRMAEEVKKMIQQLPTLTQLKKDDALEVKKARLYYDSLSSDQQKIVTNIKDLEAAEKRIDELIKAALDQEEFEDDTDFDAYHEMVLKGDKLTITSTKSAGAFKIVLPDKVLQTVMDTKVKQIELKDERGVQWLIDNKVLQKALNQTRAEKLQLYISQYDYDSSLFEVKLATIQGKKETPITLPNTFIKITIPYTFFVDGQHVNKLTLFREEGRDIKTTPYTSSNKHIMMQLQRGGIFWFGKKEATFSDLANLANRDEVLALAERQIIKGRLDGTFGPYENITRAQFATMVARALGVTPQTTKSPFMDVRGKAFEQDVQALYEAGIIQGVNATTFNPQGKLTRQQAAVMMARTLRYADFKTETISPNTNFKDVNRISEAALRDIGVLNTLDIMSGNANGFNPSGHLTRAQMAKILKRTLGIIEML